MPTAWAHEFYFNNSSTAVAPVLAAGAGGYPLWQAGVITPSLLGGLQVYWERIAWWGRLFRKVWRLPRSLHSALDLLVDGLLVPVGHVATVAQAYPVAVSGKVQRRSGIVCRQPTTIKKPTLLQRWTAPKVKDAPAEKSAPTALLRAAMLLEHPAYPVALEAVKRTRETVGFHKPESWQGLSRQMKASPGAAENIFRHMHACQYTRSHAPSTLSNPDCNLLVELAYHEMAR